MTLFWIAAAALAALTAVLMVARAAQAAKASPLDEDPSVAVYRRQLGEVDDLAARGLLDEEERRRAAAEAGRRLLDAHRSAPARPVATRAAGRAVLVAAALAAAAALGVYFLKGAPGVPDAPFRQRLEQWSKADPRSLDASQMAAVLEKVAKERPRDPEVLTYLAQAQLAAGDTYAAIDALKRAAVLAPTDPLVFTLLGEAQMRTTAETDVTPEAEQAFRKVLQLRPGDPAARFFVAQAQVARGETAQGLAAWRALRADLPAGDPRLPTLDAQIAQAEADAGPQSAAGQAIAAAPPAGQTAMIQGMVANLAAKLEANPDDPAGWARLIRSYGVLGQADAQGKAIAKARALFARRPKDLALIETEAAR